MAEYDDISCKNCEIAKSQVDCRKKTGNLVISFPKSLKKVIQSGLFQVVHLAGVFEHIIQKSKIKQTLR